MSVQEEVASYPKPKAASMVPRMETHPGACHQIFSVDGDDVYQCQADSYPVAHPVEMVVEVEAVSCPLSMVRLAMTRVFQQAHLQPVYAQFLHALAQVVVLESKI